VNGIYIYCLTKKCNLNGFNTRGLDEQAISTIFYKDIMALMHPYTPGLLQGDDTGKVVEDAMIHHKVVEDAWEAFGTLIPLRFGSIIQGENEAEAMQNVKDWLERIYNHLTRRFEDLKDKAEYGIQIFWSNEGLIEKIVNNHDQIKSIDKKIASSPKDTAYVYKDRQKNLLQRYIAKEIVTASRSLLDRVRPYLDDFQIEQITFEESDKRMLLNISCLLSEKQISNIRQALNEIEHKEGYIPCLSGPWPPYSFARLDEKLCPRNGHTYQVAPGGRVRCV
jgi:hypothetical protein